VHLPQRELVAGRLGAAVGDLLARPAALQSLAENARKRARPHAADEIARHALALLRAE
jgi:UDP-N-acetylglucosamine:LPS N-acetylglucosamine transferase